MFFNPFVPFMSDLGSGEDGRLTFRDSSGNAFMSSENSGGQVLLRDEIGRNIGSIQHFTDDWSIIRDASGIVQGSIQELGPSTMFSDAHGHVLATGHEMGSHFAIDDPSGQHIGDIGVAGQHVVGTDGHGHLDWSASDN